MSQDVFDTRSSAPSPTDESLSDMLMGETTRRAREYAGYIGPTASDARVVPATPAAQPSRAPAVGAMTPSQKVSTWGPAGRREEASKRLERVKALAAEAAKAKPDTGRGRGSSTSPELPAKGAQYRGFLPSTAPGNVPTTPYGIVVRPKPDKLAVEVYPNPADVVRPSSSALADVAKFRSEYEPLKSAYTTSMREADRVSSEVMDLEAQRQEAQAAGGDTSSIDQRLKAAAGVARQAHQQAANAAGSLGAFGFSPEEVRALK